MIRRLSYLCSLVAAACTGSGQPVLTSDDGGPSDDAGLIEQPNTNPWTMVASGTTTDLYSISGTAADDVVAVGGTPGDTSGTSGVVVRWNGTSWTATANLVNLMAVSGPSAVGEYGGEGSQTFWTGTMWSAREVLAPGTLRATWTASDGTYVAGANGRLMYTSEPGIPGGWQTLISNTPDRLNAVWGKVSADIFAVGDGGVVLHNNSAGLGGGTWNKTFLGLGSLTGVWGSSVDNVYVVGVAPAVVHHSQDGGASWVQTSPPSSTATGLFGVGGRSATDVYLVGATGGVIFHSSGGDVWTPEPTPTTKDLFGVWVAPNGEAFAVGRGGTILHKAAP